MEGWARVDEVDEPWKARAEEAERRFFGHDLYRLNLWRTGGSIAALARGESKPQELGKVEVTEREIRIGDAQFHTVVDVRRDRYSRWPRDVFAHGTGYIGTIRRRSGWGGRPSWVVVDGEGEAAAIIREASLGAAALRNAVGVAVWAVKVVVTFGNTSGRISEPRTDFLVSGAARQLGEIRGGHLLDLTADPGRELDRRLAVAAFVSILAAETGA
jgi:hypothetical protein